MITFIDDHRGAYGVEPICKVLLIAPSTYRAHAAKRLIPPNYRRARSRMRSAKSRRDQACLRGELRRLWRTQGSCGNCVARARISHDVHRELTDRGSMGLARRDPGKAVVKTIDQRQGRPVSAGSCQPPVPSAWCRTRSKLPDFTYVATRDRFRLRRVRHRRLRSAHRHVHRPRCEPFDALEQALHDRRPYIMEGLCITATGAANTSRSNTPSAWRKRGSSSDSSVGDSYDNARRNHQRSQGRGHPPARAMAVIRGCSSSRRWRWTGSTIAGCWSPSATSRQLEAEERYAMKATRHGGVTQTKHASGKPKKSTPIDFTYRY